MTDPSQPSRLTPPALTELFAQYLQGRIAANEAGVGFAEPGEVVPHEAVPAQPVDPRLAWEEARLALHYYNPRAETQAWKAPPDWSTLVSTQEPTLGLPLCVGHFPQMVRHLQPLLHPDHGAARPGSGSRSAPAFPVPEWIHEADRKAQTPQLLLAVGTLRLARHLDQAADLLRRHQAKVPAEWQAAWANEDAALAWQRGQAEQAAQQWRAQSPSVPVLFNRGMAALFLGQPAEARAALAQAANQLPESTGWHHLARLYLALAEAR